MMFHARLTHKVMVSKKKWKGITPRCAIGKKKTDKHVFSVRKRFKKITHSIHFKLRADLMNWINWKYGFYFQQNEERILTNTKDVLKIS